MGVDKVIHKFGKRSNETRNALKKIDKIIEKYIKYFDGEICLWSDHGFADIKNYINIWELLPKRKDYLYFIAGTTVHFWFGNDNVKREVKEILGKIDGGGILDEKSAKKYKIPLDRKYGGLIFYVKKGNYFFPNFYQKSLKKRFIAMHGYPNDRELNGFLMSNKKDKNLKTLNINEILQ
jgi:predicted AlkP superfamily pyrophosphatase or phosphodiesterase